MQDHSNEHDAEKSNAVRKRFCSVHWREKENRLALQIINIPEVHHERENGLNFMEERM